MDPSIKNYNRQVSGQVKMGSVNDGSLKPLEMRDFDGKALETQPSLPVTAYEMNLLHELIGNTFINATNAKGALRQSLNNPVVNKNESLKRVVKIMIHQLDKILDIVADPENNISLRRLLDKITISG